MYIFILAFSIASLLMIPFVFAYLYLEELVDLSSSLIKTKKSKNRRYISDKDFNSSGESDEAAANSKSKGKKVLKLYKDN